MTRLVSVLLNGMYYVGRNDKLTVCAVLRCFVSGDSALLTRAFTVYVRPILITVLHGHLNFNKTLKKIERVQRRYIKRLRGFANVSYTERLRRLQLHSLELWRLFFDLCMCYRIIFGLVNVCVSDFFELNRASQTRGHPYKLYKQRSHSSVRAFYFAIRVINAWNSLPADRADFSSFACFKRTVEQIYFTPWVILIWIDRVTVSVTEWPCSPGHTCCSTIRFMYSCIAILPCVE